MRKQARKDDNHNLIVRTFKAIGFSVLDLSTVGGGCPDILIGIRGRNYLVEIKSEKGKPTPDQVYFRKAWRGGYAVARSSDDVLSIGNSITMLP